MADFTVNGNINSDGADRDNVESAMELEKLTAGIVEQLTSQVLQDLNQTLKAISQQRNDSYDALVKSLNIQDISLKSPKEKSLFNPEEIINEAFKTSEEAQPVSLSPSSKKDKEPERVEGYVRVYHSGIPSSQEVISKSPKEAQTAIEPTYVSTSKETVAAPKPKEPIYYLDLPANDPRLSSPEKKSDQGFVFNFQLSPEESKRLKKLSDGFESDYVNEPFGKSKDPLKQSSENILRSAEKFSKSADKLEDLSDAVYNDLFDRRSANGGGDGGEPPVVSVSPSPEDDDSNEPSPQLEMVMNVLGKGKLLQTITQGAAVTAVAKYAIDSVKSFAAMYTDLAKNVANTYVQGLSSPQSVSPVQTALQPVQSAANTAGPVGGVAGAAIGTAIAPGIGTVLGGMIGSALGSQFSGAISEIINTLDSIDKGIVNMSKDLRAFNSELMSASVEASIARLESRFQQADDLGPLLAENVRARSQFETSIRELTTSLSKIFLPVLTTITKIGTAAVELITAGFNEVVEFFTGVLDLIMKIPGYGNMIKVLATTIQTNLDTLVNVLAPPKPPAFSPRMHKFMLGAAMGGFTNAAWWNQGQNAQPQNIGPGPQVPFIPEVMGITF